MSSNTEEENTSSPGMGLLVEESEPFDLMEIVAVRCNNNGNDTNEGGAPNRIVKEEEKLRSYNKSHEASQNSEAESTSNNGTTQQHKKRRRARENNEGEIETNALASATDSDTKNKTMNPGVEVPEEFDVMSVIRARARGELTPEMTKKNMNSMDYLNSLRMTAAKMAMTEEDQVSAEAAPNNNMAARPSGEEEERTTRQMPATPASAPGAYSGAPGQSLQRNTKVEFSSIAAQQHTTSVDQTAVLGDEERPTRGTEEEADNPLQTTMNGTNAENRIVTDVSTRKLPAAELVHEESVWDVELQPIDADEAANKEAKTERQRKIFSGITAILLSVTLIIVLGFIFGPRNKNSVQASSGRFPTVVPSFAPSDVPSSAPTGALDTMRAILPNYTITSLQADSNSPQNKAFRWLENHRNISNLEEWRKLQIFGLAIFYYSFQGEHWPGVSRGWLRDDIHECNWWSYMHGGFVDEEFFSNVYNITKDGDGQYEDFDGNSTCDLNGRFRRLDIGRVGILEVEGLTPKIPPEISLLSHLESIAISENRFRANLKDLLPSELSELSHLQKIEIIRNENISGSIPSTLGTLTQLTKLDLQSSYITGQLPSQIGVMSSLKELQILANGLKGTIPSTFGDLNRLYLLSLRSCSLGGSIPSEIGKMAALKYLHLDNNQLTGAVPSEIFTLPFLEFLTLKGNSIEPTVVSPRLDDEATTTGQPIYSEAVNSSLCQSEAANTSIMVQVRPLDLVFRVLDSNATQDYVFDQTFEIETTTAISTGSKEDVMPLSSIVQWVALSNAYPSFVNLTDDLSLHHNQFAQGEPVSTNVTSQLEFSLPVGEVSNQSYHLVIQTEAVTRNEDQGEEYRCISNKLFEFQGGIPLRVVH